MIKAGLVYAAVWLSVRAIVAAVVVAGWNLLAPWSGGRVMTFAAGMGISFMLAAARSLFPVQESKTPTLISLGRATAEEDLPIN